MTEKRKKRPMREIINRKGIARTTQNVKKSIKVDKDRARKKK